MNVASQGPSKTSASTPSMTSSNLPARLRVAGLTKSYAGNVVLRDVDFITAPGEIHALVGENGAGKSTLINLITGVTSPDRGQLVVDGSTHARMTPQRAERLGIATVHQELSLSPHLTVAENIHLGHPPTRWGLLDRDVMQSTVQRQLADLDVHVDPDSIAGELSLAEQQLVEIAKATIQKPSLLILDEATSALDNNQTALLFAFLRRLRDDGASIIFVSHRMEEIFSLCDRITVLRNGEFVATVPADETSIAELVRMMIGRDVEDTFPPKPDVTGVLQRPVVLSARNLGSGQRFRDVTFDLHQGEILGLGGLQGQGQHDLLEALFGQHGIDGDLTFSGQSLTMKDSRDAIRGGIAYIPEDRKTDGLLVPLSVRENLLLPSLSRLSHRGVLLDGENSLVQDLVQRLEIRLRSPRQTLSRLSGGNQQKVAIAKWLPLSPNLFLLAEPTRGIDVGTKQEIYRLLRKLTDAGASILLISSDTIELLGLCDRVLVMYERRPVTILEGQDVTEENIVHASVAGRVAGSTESASNREADYHAISPAHLESGKPPSGNSSTGWFESRTASLPRDWRNVAPIYLLMMVFAVAYLFSVRETVSLGTLNNLSAYLFPLILTALGQSVIMLTGGIDLSTGAMVSLATVLLATQMHDNPVSMVGAVLFVLLVGGLLGVFTGGVVTLARIPAIIVTLATSFLWSGLALFVLATPGGHLPDRFADGLTGQVGGTIPVTLLVLIAVMIAWKTVKNSPLGLHIYAVGDNPRGAFISGVNVHRTRIAAYAIAGILVMIGGMGLAAYASTGDPLIGTTYTLASIAAAVLGGISFFGGQGQLRGTIAGALILGLLIQILFISGLSPSWQRVVQGSVLIIALGVKAVASARMEEGS